MAAASAAAEGIVYTEHQRKEKRFRFRVRESGADAAESEIVGAKGILWRLNYQSRS